MIEIGLLVCIILVALALKTEESLPEERQVQEKVLGASYSDGLWIAGFLFFIALVISVIGGTNG